MLNIIPVSGTDVLAAVLRVVVGVAFVMHGLPKVRGGWKQSGQWIKSAGVPSGAAVPVTILEFFGGIFLIIGLIVPVVSAFFAIQMVAIVIMKKFGMHGNFISSSREKPSYEIDVLYLLLALALVVLGAGVLSVDALIGF